MIKFFKKHKIRNKISIFFLFCVLFLFLLNSRDVNAGFVSVSDSLMQAGQEAQSGGDKAKWSWEKFWENMKEQLKKAGSKAFGSAFSTTIKQMAYDSATYLASGGEGQKPLFFKEGWGEFLDNVGSAAAGNFIESLNESFDGFLCSPSIDLKVSLGRGLASIERPAKPNCDWSKMKNAWTNEFQKYQDLSRADFLKKFEGMFSPGNNDISVALKVQDEYVKYVYAELEKKSKDREESGGWFEFRDIANLRETFPGSTNKEGEAIYDIFDEPGQYTGNALIDALNIFVNQYTMTLIKTQLRNLAKDSDTLTSRYSGNYGGLFDYEFGSTGGGIEAAKEKFSKIVEPSFNTRGDYDILAELTLCPDPNNAGPTNCVINDNFRQAIENKMTVGQAVDAGYLNKEGIFGFINSDLEPSFQNDEYPYRSMKILKKFRIIPVGWEVAAQYIRDNDVGSCSLGDMIACYSSADSDKYTKEEYSSGSCKMDDGWCQGMVNPDWLLKAPLNYCKREGYGPEIMFAETVGSGDDSYVMINRNDAYCADEQSCIKEDDNGSCEKYGYCVEERSKWDFNADSCNPLYNTCQTFRSQSGQTYSFLQNTLDYCDSDAVGCEAYCTSYDYDIEGGYASSTWACTSSTDETKFLNREMEECEAENEGCHEFIRTKKGLGANLVRNSGFENDLDAWTEFAGNTGSVSVVPATGVYNETDNKVLNINHDGSDGYTAVEQVVDNISGGEQVSVSYYVKNDLLNSSNSGAWLMIQALNSSGQAILDPQTGDAFVSESLVDNEYNGNSLWNKNEFSFITPQATTRLRIQIKVEDLLGETSFDNIKVERGDSATQYTDYRANNLVYLKLLPPYLRDVCYDNTGKLKNGAPEECNAYVRECKPEEAGCGLYTSQTSDLEIPGKVEALDYCEAECVGYDTYIQTGTPYDKKEPAYFIPDTARTCNAEAVGCEEFTNLDKIGLGAEQKEYYSQLKKCIKPDENVCGVFYTWNSGGGSDIDFQFHTLKKESGVNTPDADICLEENLNPFSSNYNPDCREFINDQGDKSYHLYSDIIECSDDCHPYRLSDTYGDMTETECETDLDGSWLNNACVFMAIPDQGVKCRASQVGCREYNGNLGNNVRINYVEDFESDSEWVGGTRSSDAVISGGHSYGLTANLDVSLEIGSLVNRYSAYTLSFIAKATDANDIASTSVYFDNQDANDDKQFAYFDSVGVSGTDWMIYRTRLDSLDHAVSLLEKLVIVSDQDIYIDNIRLTEIVDRYYLVKNSWNTPEVCDQDVYGNFSLYNDLGCDHYRDLDDVDYYLHNFSELCSESAAGCELMIDTHNYSNYNGGTWTKGNVDQLTEVSADSATYVVYDPDKSCFAEDKGCQFFGEIYSYNNELSFVNKYIKNDPDQYDKGLCNGEDIGCESWDHEDGPSYFMDPGQQICEWREESGGFGWFKKKVKRCGRDGNICFEDNDCEDEACELEDAVNTCSITYNKTFGLGGLGNRVAQPYSASDEPNWVGLCPASESGCTEYIDSMSRFSNNTLFNPSCNDIDGIDASCDGWDNPTTNPSQEISLDPYTLYVLSVTRGNGGAEIRSCRDSSGNDSLIGGFDYSINRIGGNYTSTSTDANQSVMFYSGSSTVCSVSGGAPSKTIELKKAMIDYQDKNEVNREDCNGIVNQPEGCVLFNERTFNSGGYVSLDKNSFKTDDGKSPSTEVVTNANEIIKVTPDRVCNKWLSCLSYVKDSNGNNTCFSIGLCDSFDQNNNCDNPIAANISPENLSYSESGMVNTQALNSMSGYARVGYDSLSMDSFDKLPSSLYSLGDMKEEGENIYIPNSGFESYGDNMYPMGWNYDSQNSNVSSSSQIAEENKIFTGVDVDGMPVYDTVETNVWNPNIFRVIDNIKEAQDNGICFRRDQDDSCYLFNPEGKAFLQVGAKYSATSELATLIPGYYTVSFYVNSINLNSGQAILDVRNAEGDKIYIDSGELSLSARKGWTYKVGNFDLQSTEQIMLILKASSTDPNLNLSGSIYFDDIRIKPALEVSEFNNNEWMVPQTCRLYPEDSSLSCDYYDDSGVRQKGWPGYCLDYDRPPGRTDACIMWYPIDKVKGDGIEEGAGYDGDFPVYYCVEATRGSSLVTRSAQRLSRKTYDGYVSGSGCGRPMNVYGPLKDVWNKSNNVKCSDAFMDRCSYDPYSYSSVDDFDFNNQPIGDSYLTRRMWDVFDSNHDDSGGDITTTWECQNHYYNDMFCTKIVQVVSPTGQNKAWSSRVYEGSDEVVSCNIDNVPGLDISSLDNKCGYGLETKPFGAISSPEPTNNPYEWDSNKDTEEKDPLYYDGLTAEDMQNDLKATTPDMGELHSTGILKTLFAESYGAWIWSSNACDGGDKEGEYCESNDDCNMICEQAKTCQHSDYDSGISCESNDECQILIYEYECNNGRCDGGPKNGEACSSEEDCRPFCDNNTCIGGPHQGEACSLRGTPDDYYCREDNDQDNEAIKCLDDGLGVYRCNGGDHIGEECGIKIESLDNYPDQLFVNCSTAIENNSCSLSDTFKFYENTNIACENSTEGNECVDVGEPGYRFYSDGIWGPPETKCLDQNKRSNNVNEYCSMLPKVESSDIEIAGYDENINPEITGSGFVNLNFYSDVDDDQLPMVMYRVYWGDNDQTVISGVEMRDRPKPAEGGEGEPHSLFHLYSYWNMRSNFARNMDNNDTVGFNENSVYCGAGGDFAYNNRGDSSGQECPSDKACCMVKPRVTIKDNWGWCNGASEIDKCDLEDATPYDKWIIVTEN